MGHTLTKYIKPYKTAKPAETSPKPYKTKPNAARAAETSAKYMKPHKTAETARDHPKTIQNQAKRSESSRDQREARETNKTATLAESQKPNNAKQNAASALASPAENLASVLSLGSASSTEQRKTSTKQRNWQRPAQNQTKRSESSRDQHKIHCVAGGGPAKSIRCPAALLPSNRAAEQRSDITAGQQGSMAAWQRCSRVAG